MPAEKSNSDVMYAPYVTKCPRLSLILAAFVCEWSFIFLISGYLFHSRKMVIPVDRAFWISSGDP